MHILYFDYVLRGSEDDYVVRLIFLNGQEDRDVSNEMVFRKTPIAYSFKGEDKKHLLKYLSDEVIESEEIPSRLLFERRACGIALKELPMEVPPSKEGIVQTNSLYFSSLQEISSFLDEVHPYIEIPQKLRE